MLIVCDTLEENEGEHHVAIGKGRVNEHMILLGIRELARGCSERISWKRGDVLNPNLYVVSLRARESLTENW